MKGQRGTKSGLYKKPNKYRLLRALTPEDFQLQLARVYDGKALEIPLARLTKRFPNFQNKCDDCLRYNTHPIISIN